MPAWSERTLTRLNDMRQRGFSMRLMCIAFTPQYSRDDVVEAIDALRRHDTVDKALAHVNGVLYLQHRGVQLVNGRAQRVASMF